MFLEECKYVVREKKMPEYITEKMEFTLMILTEKFLMKKILVKKTLIKKTLMKKLSIECIFLYFSIKHFE